MGKAPAFQFYPTDRATDLDPLSMEERGMYLTIMRHGWPYGGPMPIDEVEALIGKPWLSTGLIFRRKFSEVDGHISLLWMEEERQKQVVFRELQAKKGKLGGRPSKAKKPSLSRSLTEQKPNESPRVGDGVGDGVGELKRNTRENDERFEALWLVYERYGAKGKALAYWKALTEEDRRAVEAKAPEYVASTPGCEYRKQLEGWINPANRLWERPIIKRVLTAPKPLTQGEARRELEKVRASLGIAPGGPIANHQIPAHILEALG